MQRRIDQRSEGNLIPGLEQRLCKVGCVRGIRTITREIGDLYQAEKARLVLGRIRHRRRNKSTRDSLALLVELSRAPYLFHHDPFLVIDLHLRPVPVNFGRHSGQYQTS